MAGRERAQTLNPNAQTGGTGEALDSLKQQLGLRHARTRQVLGRVRTCMSKFGHLHPILSEGTVLLRSNPTRPNNLWVEPSIKRIRVGGLQGTTMREPLARHCKRPQSQDSKPSEKSDSERESKKIVATCAHM